MKEKVAFIYPEPLPDNKARAVSVLNTANAMSAHLPTTLIHQRAEFPPKTAPTLHRISLSKSFLRLKSNRIFHFNLTRHLRNSSYDFFYVRHLKTAAFLIKKRPENARIVFEAHEIFHTQNPATEALERFVYKYADAFVFTNDTLRQECKKIFPTLSDKPTAIINNGSDFSNARISKDFSHLDTLCYIGNFYPWKGVDIAIRAMRHLPEMRLQIIGDGERRKELEALAESLELNNIEFLGYLPHERIREHLAQSRLTLIPNGKSIQNLYSTPIKLYEYMATSNIVIASDMPTIREIVIDSHNGFLFETGNPTALADTVRKVKGLSADRLAQIAENAYETSRSFTWKSRGRKITEFLKSLSNGPTT